MKNGTPVSASLLWLIIIFLAACFGIALSKKKKSKQSLADFYNVSRPTLNKWIEHFQNTYTLEEWKKMRFLTALDEINTKASFGDDIAAVLNKGQIAERTESDYKTLAGMVKRNAGKLGFSFKAWQSCSAFPPTITDKIIAMM